MAMKKISGEEYPNVPTQTLPNNSKYIGKVIDSNVEGRASETTTVRKK